MLNSLPIACWTNISIPLILGNTYFILPISKSAKQAVMIIRQDDWQSGEGKSWNSDYSATPCADNSYLSVQYTLIKKEFQIKTGKVAKHRKVFLLLLSKGGLSG
jgi:hypothetical protein